MSLKEKVTILILIDSFLFLLIIFLLFKGMWFESLIPLLLSLAIASWNFPVYKKYFSPKDDKNREEKN
tara:strand:- start:143 stop:346 length:204 start_codon:yes stop_codon:yes gene_type:complete